MRKLIMVGGAAAVALALGGRVFAPGTRGRKKAKKSAFRAGQQLRYMGGRLHGLGYRLGGRRPDPDVPDTVLADRIRSQIGNLERTLDVPHIHVMVNDRIATLHGDVSIEADAKLLEQAVLNVSGVRGIHSFLHAGLIAGDSRPSEGRSTPAPSEQHQRLLEAARHTGLGDEMALAAVRAVLSTLAERLPENDREHLCSHLPVDVRRLMRPPRRRGVGIDLRTPEEFVQAVAASGAVEAARAPLIVESILGALRRLVPEEARDISAVLPAELRKLWDVAVPQ